MDIQSYYIIVKEASDRLRSFGMMCPEIKMEHIIIDGDTGEPCYALDLNKVEENRYHHCLRELDKIINEMMGIKEQPLAKTFKVHFDENFSRDIPPCWYEKSKPENIFKKFDFNGNLLEEKDKYQTYDDSLSAKADTITQPIAQPSPLKDMPANTSELDKILNSCVIDKNLPDTYS